MKVLVTGDNGYIGSVLTATFVEAGHEVVGLDSGLFEACSVMPAHCPDSVASLRKDLRDVTLEDLHSVDAVVHLAALSNDPIGKLNATWTKEINVDASVRLAALARAAGVHRFLFSSSCIMYGMSEEAEVSEDSPLDPKTDYARSKVAAESAIGQLAGPNFSPIFLRNGTVYGPSPRIRFDTVLNNLVGQAVATGQVVIESDGEPWRPVVHVNDVARAFLALLDAPIELIHNQAFNVGADHLNHQVKDLAAVAIECVPDAKLTILAQPTADQRTYRAGFAKFAATFPDFRFEWSTRAGALDLVSFLRGLEAGAAVFLSPRFTRLEWLRHLLSTGALDASLRWVNPAGYAE